MNTLVVVCVVLYILLTLAIGAWAGSRIKNTEDFAVAGHSLPLIMVITTSFATWFGAETVMGIPARFVEGGLESVVEDPFGASMCLVLVGLFFAGRLYRLKLLTIGDYYRKRYGESVEILCSLMIILSYLGWVAAQITALGLVFSIISAGFLSVTQGMVVGTVIVLIYVLMGGMLAIAWTDFLQMTVLVIGLSYIAWTSAELVGGASSVFELAESRELFRVFPQESTATTWAFFIASAVTMMFGSIPQQDIFQRVMSANSVHSARWGATIGGLCYLVFAFVPMFVVLAAILALPDDAPRILEEDAQQLLPTLILEHMPVAAQIFFFGALISAIKSTSSATLLAPSTSFVENILKNIVKNLTDRQLLLAMRLTILIFTVCVLLYAIWSQGTTIYEMVSQAYQVTLVGSFVPLTFGLYWRKANTQGAILSIALGIGTWVMILFAPQLGSVIPAMTELPEIVPAQLAGLVAALIGMIVGSLMPTFIHDKGQPNYGFDLDSPTT